MPFGYTNIDQLSHWAFLVLVCSFARIVEPVVSDVFVISARFPGLLYSCSTDGTSFYLKSYIVDD